MLKYLKAQGMVRGVLGGSHPWAVLWLAIVVRDRLRKHGEPQPVYRVELKPGSALAISHLVEDHRGRVPRRLRNRAHSMG